MTARHKIAYLLIAAITLAVVAMRGEPVSCQVISNMEMTCTQGGKTWVQDRP